MTPAPPSPPRNSSRSQHAERNVRLDPQGIYGTRSARRQGQLRRRRQLQNGILWAIGAAATLILMRWALQPRHSARAATRTVPLPFRPAGAPLALGDGDLLFTSQSGGLWRAPANQNGLATAPRRLFSAGFAPAASPLVTSTQIFWPGGDGLLIALEASGKPRWRATLPSALVAKPALVRVDGRAIVVAGDDAGHIAAFDAETGVLRWKKSLGGALGAGIGVLAAQKGAGEGVLVPLLAGAASRGGLVCLDAKTGALRWSFPGDARSQSAGIALPASLENQVFWCNDEGAVVCLEGATGRKIWKSFAVPLVSETGATAAPDDQLVMLRGAPTLVEAAGVVVVGGNDGALRAFDLATGAPRWTRPLGGAIRFAAQKLVFEGKNALLATAEAPAVWLLDAKDGAILRRWTTPYPNSYGLALTSKNAYSLDADGHLQVAPLQ